MTKAELLELRLRRYMSNMEFLTGYTLDYVDIKTQLGYIAGDPHYHKAGTLVGLGIDECAMCGRDLRDSVHKRN